MRNTKEVYLKGLSGKGLSDKGRLKLPKPKDLTVSEFYYLKDYIDSVIKLFNKK